MSFSRRMAGRPGMTAALVVAAAGVLLAGCDLVMTDLSAQATDQWTRTYTLASGGRIDVRNINGRIEVLPSDSNKVEVRAEKIGKGATDESAKQALERIEITEQVSDTDVRLETKIERSVGFNMGGTEVRYYLRVPIGIEVRVETTNGAIQVESVAAGLTAETTNGTISGRHVSGRISASTVNGGIDLDVDAIGEGGITLETVNGGVELTLPRDAAANISASLANGRIDAADLEIETRGEISRRRLDGTLNGGGERVRVETTNGSITLKGKAKAG